MSTHCATHFHFLGSRVASVYRQHDGDFETHGSWLAEWLVEGQDKELSNTLSMVALAQLMVIDLNSEGVPSVEYHRGVSRPPYKCNYVYQVHGPKIIMIAGLYLPEFEVHEHFEGEPGQFREWLREYDKEEDVA